MNTTSLSVRHIRGAKLRLRSRSAFTMFEVLLVIVALGLLAALVVPTIDRFFDATNDTTKAHNAQLMNQYMDALFNAGYDTATWADGASAIRDLTNGVEIKPTVAGGLPQTIKLKQPVNAQAYTFTPGVATPLDKAKPPTFTAILNDRTQRP